MCDKSTTVSVTVKSVLKIASVSVASETSVEVKLDKKPEKTLEASAFAVKENGNNVAVSKVEVNEADLTGKTLILTIDSLKGKQGELTVNDVKATIPAKQVYAFDFKRPTIEGVSVVSANTLKVKFSEKMSEDGLKDALKVRKVSDGSTVAPVTAILDADGTTATVVLSSTDENSHAFKLTVADYVLVAAKNATKAAKDVKGNEVIDGTEYVFKPSSEDLDNTNEASIVKVTYNKVTNLLKMTFDRNISDSLMKPEKLSINGISLADVKAESGTPDDNEYVLDLKDKKDAIDALSGDLKLTSEAGAYGVVGGTDAADILTKGETVAVKIVKSAVITNVSYEEESKKLTVTFDQDVTLDKSVAATGQILKITNSNSAGATAAAFTKEELDTKNSTGNTWIFHAKWDGSTASANLMNQFRNDTNLKAFVVSGMESNIKNTDDTDVTNAGTQSKYEDGVAVTFTKDENKPVLTSAVFNNKTQKLKLTFSEDVAALTSTNFAKIKLYDAKGEAFTTANLGTLTATAETIDGKTNRKVYDVDVQNIATTLEAEFQKTNGGIKIVLDEEAITDDAGLKSAATTVATGVDVKFDDFVAPTIVPNSQENPNAIRATNKNEVQISFNEPVSEETAENIANYTITNTRDEALAVKKAVLLPDKKKVYLTTEDQTANMKYAVMVKNIEDLAGNKADITKVTFDGSAATESEFKVNDTITVSAPAGANNDTIAVTFSGTPNTHLALDPANYIIQQGGAPDADGNLTGTVKKISTTGAEVSLNDKTATITFKNGVNLQNGSYYKVTVANVTSITGKAMDTGKNVTNGTPLTGVSATTFASVTACNKKEGAIVLTFNGDLDITEAQKAGNYAVTYTDAGNQNKDAAVTKATYKETKNTNGTTSYTVTLDLKEDLKGATSVKVKAKAALKNLAGVNCVEKEITVSSIDDKLAPTISSIKAIANADDGSKINVEFDETVFTSEQKQSDGSYIADDARNLSHYVLKEDGTAIALQAKEDATKPYADITVTGGKTVSIALHNFNLNVNKNYTLDIADVKDASGNKMEAVSGAKAVWSSTANEVDKTAPAISEVTGAGTTVKVEFDEKVDSAANKGDNYTLKEKTSGKAVTVTAARVGDDGKTVYLTLAAALTEDTDYTVSVENVSDLYGNKISTTAPKTKDFKAGAAGSIVSDRVPVTYTADGATVKVTNNDASNTEVSSGSQVTTGNKLKVVVTPKDGYILDSVKVNGTAQTLSSGGAAETISNYDTTGKSAVKIDVVAKKIIGDVLSIDYENETVTAAEGAEGYSYGTTTNPTTSLPSSATAINTNFGSFAYSNNSVTFYIKKGSDASNGTAVTLERPAAPTQTEDGEIAATLSGNKLTIANVAIKDGKTYQYSKNGTNWYNLTADTDDTTKLVDADITSSGSEVDTSSNNTIYIRTKASADTFASATTQQLTITNAE